MSRLENGLTRDRGATLKLGGTISDSILGGTKHFFLLIFYNFKNIGEALAPLPPPPPSSSPRSLLTITVLTQSANFFFLTPQKLPDPQFQPLKVTTNVHVRSSMGVPPRGGRSSLCRMFFICILLKHAV